MVYLQIAGQKVPLMSSEQEKLYNSSDNEDRRRPKLSHSSEDKAAKSLGDLQEIKPAPMRYYQGINNQPSMMQRPHAEIQPRQPVAAISPRAAGMTDDSDLTDAMVFLNRIKEEYSDSLPIYDSFLETMRDFKFGKIDADEVCKAVRLLFKDKAYLVRQFDEYLPVHLRYGDNRAFNPHAPPHSDRQKYVQYRVPGYANNPAMPMARMMHGQNMHMSRPMPPHSFVGHAPRTNPPLLMPGQPRPPKPALLDSESPEHYLAEEFIQLVKKKYLAKPFIYKQFIDILKNCKTGFDKLLSQVTALLNDSPDLVEKFEKNFRPTNSSETIYSVENDPLKNIKDVLAEKGLLEDFLRIINFYNQNYINANDLIFLLDPIITDKEGMKAFKLFIKYEDTSNDTDPDKFKDCETVGSYKIFPGSISINSSSAIAKEVLNNICRSVSTLESEDDV